MKVSKWVLAVGTAGFLMVGCVVPAHAQMAPKNRNVVGGPMLRHPLLGRLAVVLGRLNLSPDQKAQIKGFLVDAQTKAKAVRTNTSLTPEQKRTQVQEIMKSLRESITGILTPEQRAKARRLLAAAPGPRPMLTRWMVVLSRLNLSPAQKTQVRGFVADAQAKAKIVRESNLAPAEKRTKMQEIEKALRQSILGILTPQQRQRLERILSSAPGRQGAQ